MTQAGSGQLGQRWRHNCAMFNSKLQETIKRATPVGVMGAECRRNVATPRGNHSLSRRAGAQLVVGCSRSAWTALDNATCTVFGSRGTVGGRGRCNSTSAMLLRVLEPRSPVPHFNEIRPPFRRRPFFDRSRSMGYNEFEINNVEKGYCFSTKIYVSMSSFLSKGLSRGRRFGKVRNRRDLYWKGK